MQYELYYPEPYIEADAEMICNFIRAANPGCDNIRPESFGVDYPERVIFVAREENGKIEGVLVLTVSCLFGTKIAQVECLATKGRFDDADAKGLLDKAIWYAKNTGCGIIELTLPYHIVAVDNFLSRADFNPPVGLTGYSMAL